MITKEHIIQQVHLLSPLQLKEVAFFIKFLQYKKSLEQTQALDSNKLANLYKMFEAEDVALAEQGMADYYSGLQKEGI